MTYASLQDLIDRAGAHEILQVADRNDDGLIDDEVITASLAHAQAIIDGYLGGRYSVPINPVPPILRAWSVAIARYHLHRDGAPEHVAQDHKDAIAALKDAEAGRLTIADAETSPAAASLSGQVFGISPTEVFSAALLQGWRR